MMSDSMGHSVVMVWVLRKLAPVRISWLSSWYCWADGHGMGWWMSGAAAIIDPDHNIFCSQYCHQYSTNNTYNTNGKGWGKAHPEVSDQTSELFEAPPPNRCSLPLSMMIRVIIMVIMMMFMVIMDPEPPPPNRCNLMIIMMMMRIMMMIMRI